MAAPTTSGTARGVAKARDIESMLPPELRLVDDPYAAAMAGWRTPRWLLRCSGHGLRQAISDALTCPGYVQLMEARTRLFAAARVPHTRLTEDVSRHRSGAGAGDECDGQSRRRVLD